MSVTFEIAHSSNLIVGLVMQGLVVLHCKAIPADSDMEAQDSFTLEMIIWAMENVPDYFNQAKLSNNAA